MQEVEIRLDESIDKNASIYFDRSKKAKKKLEGALGALERLNKKLAKIPPTKEPVKKIIQKVRKKEWYEKFRWFFSSEGFLCVGGRDATTNEILIKKYAEEGDIVFHTDMAGSPFFVVKKGEDAGEKTMDESADATVSYSRAWRKGMSSLEVFYVKPEQVSKRAKSGEHLSKGAFMIYGDTKYLLGKVKIAVGKDDKGRIIGGPVDAIKKYSKDYFILVPGNKKSSDIAKKIAKKFDSHPDDILPFIPSGGSDIERS